MKGAEEERPRADSRQGRRPKRRKLDNEESDEGAERGNESEESHEEGGDVSGEDAENRKRRRQSKARAKKQDGAGTDGDDLDGESNEEEGKKVSGKKQKKKKKKKAEDEDFPPDATAHHSDTCYKCLEGGELLCCDYCTSAWHLSCLDPPLSAVPEGEWACPLCEAAQMAAEEQVEWLKQEELKVDKILDRRVIATDPEGNQLYEYYVKLSEQSYIHCIWVTAEQLMVNYSGMLRFFNKRRVASGSDWQFGEGYDAISDEVWANGVNNAWKSPHRVIAARVGGEYLVKWRGLGYDHCTWEHRDDLAADTDLIQAFEQREAQDPREGGPKLGEGANEPLVPLEGQPEFLTQLGLSLHPYQISGVNWLREAWSKRQNVLLGDDSALGKSVQVLCALNFLFVERRLAGPVLIVVPVSSLGEWEKTVDVWAPDLNVVTYSGTAEARRTVRTYELYYTPDQEAPVGNVHKLGRVKSVPLKMQCMLTSYETTVTDETIVRSVNWSTVIVDDGHRLRHRDSRQYRVIADIAADWRLLISGQPLTFWADLSHLLQWVSPEVFKDTAFFQEQCRVIPREEIENKIKGMLGSQYLRRNREQVIKMTSQRREVVVLAQMGAEQRTEYRNMLQHHAPTLSHGIAGAKGPVLACMVADLRKVSTHPYMFPATRKRLELECVAGCETEEQMADARLNTLLNVSAKLRLLDQMLCQLYQSRHRVVIFSHMMAMLDLLQEYCEWRSLGYLRVDGLMSGQQRRERIDQFNREDPSCFALLASARTASMAINMMGATAVIVFDNDVNFHFNYGLRTTIKKDAAGGDPHQVTVYRLAVANTVEERIIKLPSNSLIAATLGIGGGGMRGKKVEDECKEVLERVLRWGSSHYVSEHVDQPNGNGQIPDSSVFDEDEVRIMLTPQPLGTADHPMIVEYRGGAQAIQMSEEDMVQVADATDGGSTQTEDFWTKHLEISGSQARRATDAGREGAKDGIANQNTSRATEKGPLALSRCRRHLVNHIFRHGLQEGLWLGLPKCVALRRWSKGELKAQAAVLLHALCDPDSSMDGMMYLGKLPRAELLERIGILRLIFRKVMQYYPYNEGERRRIQVEGVVKKENGEEGQEGAGENAEMSGNTETKEGGGGTQEGAVQGKREGTDETLPPEQWDGRKENIDANAPEDACQVCAEVEQDDRMLVCAGCNALIHTWCAVPPLDDIPFWDWYCGRCKEAGHDRNPIANGSVGLCDLLKLGPREKDDATEQPCVFNVADGGFTILHLNWQSCQAQPPSLWKGRSDDYRLLVGILRHGYENWGDILRDKELGLLLPTKTEIFKDMNNKQYHQDMDLAPPPTLAAMSSFLSRRLRVLVQALSAEEQLLRADMLNIEIPEDNPLMGFHVHFTEALRKMAQLCPVAHKAYNGQPEGKRAFANGLDHLHDLFGPLLELLDRLPRQLQDYPGATHLIGMSEDRIRTCLPFASGAEAGRASETNLITGEITSNDWLVADPIKLKRVVARELRDSANQRFPRGMARIVGEPGASDPSAPLVQNQVQMVGRPVQVYLDPPAGGQGGPVPQGLAPPTAGQLRGSGPGQGQSPGQAQQQLLQQQMQEELDAHPPAPPPGTHPLATTPIPGQGQPGPEMSGRIAGAGSGQVERRGEMVVPKRELGEPPSGGMSQQWQGGAGWDGEGRPQGGKAPPLGWAERESVKDVGQGEGAPSQTLKWQSVSGAGGRPAGPGMESEGSWGGAGGPPRREGPPGRGGPMTYPPPPGRTAQSAANGREGMGRDPREAGSQPFQSPAMSPPVARHQLNRPPTDQIPPGARGMGGMKERPGPPLGWGEGGPARERQRAPPPEGYERAERMKSMMEDGKDIGMRQEGAWRGEAPPGRGGGGWASPPAGAKPMERQRMFPPGYGPEGRERPGAPGQQPGINRRAVHSSYGPAGSGRPRGPPGPGEDLDLGAYPPQRRAPPPHRDPRGPPDMPYDAPPPPSSRPIPRAGGSPTDRGYYMSQGGAGGRREPSPPSHYDDQPHHPSCTCQLCQRQKAAMGGRPGLPEYRGGEPARRIPHPFSPSQRKPMPGGGPGPGGRPAPGGGAGQGYGGGYGQFPPGRERQGAERAGSGFDYPPGQRRGFGPPPGRGGMDDEWAGRMG